MVHVCLKEETVPSFLTGVSVKGSNSFQPEQILTFKSRPLLQVFCHSGKSQMLFSYIKEYHQMNTLQCFQLSFKDRQLFASLPDRTLFKA